VLLTIVLQLNEEKRNKKKANEDKELRWLVDTTVLVYSQKENNLPISSTLGLVL
jgi:hypothetical protein